jgi:hypothetical protein
MRTPAKQSQVMTTLQDLIDAKSSMKENKSSAARRKDQILANAAQEMQNAAMRANVRRETLTDITTIEGSTSREKKGQRK